MHLLVFWRSGVKLHIDLKKGIFRSLAATPAPTPIPMSTRGINLSGLTMITAEKYLFQKQRSDPDRMAQSPKMAIGVLTCHLNPPPAREEGRAQFFKKKARFIILIL